MTIVVECVYIWKIWSLALTKPGELSSEEKGVNTVFMVTCAATLVQCTAEVLVLATYCTNAGHSALDHDSW